MSGFDDRDKRMLELLLSAVTSVLRGTGAISEIHETMQWGDRPPARLFGEPSMFRYDGGEIMISAEIAVSRVNPVDVDAVRAALSGHAVNEAAVAVMRKEVEAVRRDPDWTEFERLRQQSYTWAAMKSGLERQVKEAAELHVATIKRMQELEARLAEAQTGERMSPRWLAGQPGPIESSPVIVDDAVERFSQMELD